MNTTRISFLIIVAVIGAAFMRRPHADAPERSEVPRRLSVIVADQARDGYGAADVGAQAGDDLDARIVKLQRQVRSDPRSTLALESLGWAFVEQARVTADPGPYRLAELCALEISGLEPRSDAAALLRGHVLHALHRFDEAEVIARSLVRRRGLGIDHGLLGDVLLDRGDIDRAARHYQKMMNRRPDAQAYARVAELRFRSGDVDGAIEAGAVAARAVGRRRPEAFAWVSTRLAGYLYESGRVDQAERVVARSLDAQPDHAPSLALRGAIALERGDARAAVADLERAAAIDRSAMTAWALRDALAAAGEHDEADQVHRSIVAEGARADARSLALYLASERIAPDRALALVRDELAVRSDALTLDALAWAQAAAGASDSAQISIERALAAGAGARLYYHAGSIAESRGDAQAALEWLDKAYQHKHTLLPSEKAGLFDSLCRLEAARC